VAHERRETAGGCFWVMRALRSDAALVDSGYRVYQWHPAPGSRLETAGVDFFMMRTRCSDAGRLEAGAPFHFFSVRSARSVAKWRAAV